MRLCTGTLFSKALLKTLTFAYSHQQSSSTKLIWPHAAAQTPGWGTLRSIKCLDPSQTLCSGAPSNRAQLWFPAETPSWKAVCHGLTSCNSQNTSRYGNMITWGCSKPDPTLPWAGKSRGTQQDPTHTFLWTLRVNGRDLRGAAFQ